MFFNANNIVQVSDDKDHYMYKNSVLAFFFSLFQIYSSSDWIIPLQDAALNYFQSTREEVFFLIMEELFATSAMMLKERLVDK